MRNLIFNLFTKKEVVDIEKLKLAADLSVQNAKADPYLIRLAVDQHKLELLQPYFECVKDIDITHEILLNEEVNNLQTLISAYQILLGKNFFIKIQNNFSKDSEFKIEPFLLFPLIQNAIRYGYNSLEKYPVRIKLNLVGDSLKLEVSNRVNHHLANQSTTSLFIHLDNRLCLKYPDNHTVLVNSNTMLFKATLLLYSPN